MEVTGAFGQLTTFLIVLLPGLLSLEIARLLNVVGRRRPLDTLIGVLLFSLVDRIALALFELVPAVRARPSLLGADAATFWGAFEREGGVLMVAVAALVGVVAGKLRYQGVGFSMLRQVGLTSRTGAVDVWNETFQKMRGAGLDKWVIVNLDDGSRFMGWPVSFSDEPGVHEIFLASAVRVPSAGPEIEIPGPGILITRRAGIRSVEFLDPQPAAGRPQEACEGRS